MLPKLILRLVVFETSASEFALKLFAVKVKVVAKGIDRIIVVSKFRVDVAEEHHRILRNCHGSIY